MNILKFLGKCHELQMAGCFGAPGGFLQFGREGFIFGLTTEQSRHQGLSLLIQVGLKRFTDAGLIL